MSRQRFQFILANLTFDDAEDRPARWQCDRFAAMPHVFEECNKSFARVMIPECYLSLNETLYPMRTQINFRQYKPDKDALQVHQFCYLPIYLSEPCILWKAKR